MRAESQLHQVLTDSAKPTGCLMVILAMISSAIGIYLLRKAGRQTHQLFRMFSERPGDPKEMTELLIVTVEKISRVS